jgi:hypothetical protein
MVDWKAVYAIQVLYELKAQGAPHTTVTVEVQQAAVTDSVSTVDQYTWEAVLHVIVILAQDTLSHVK